MKTSELTGAMLDYWVAKALGGEYKQYRFADNEDAPMDMAWVFPLGSPFGATTHFEPSCDWAHGGPIIERERMRGGPAGGQSWFYQCYRKNSDGTSIPYPCGGSGSTPLIAAMRAYVASKFGDEVPDDPAAPQEDKQ